MFLGFYCFSCFYVFFIVFMFSFFVFLFVLLPPPWASPNPFLLWLNPPWTTPTSSTASNFPPTCFALSGEVARVVRSPAVARPRVAGPQPATRGGRVLLAGPPALIINIACGMSSSRPWKPLGERTACSAEPRVGSPRGPRPGFHGAAPSY